MMIERSLDHSLYNKWLESLNKKEWFYCGISLWNSYYTNQKNLQNLLTALDQNEIDARFIFFEWPNLHNQLATWKDRNEAQKEVNKRLRYHKNVLFRSILWNWNYKISSLREIQEIWYINEEKNIIIDHTTKSKLLIQRNTEVESNSSYTNNLKLIEKLYSTNANFKSDVDEEYLSINSSNILYLDEWVKYLIKEFAFIISASNILKTHSSTLIYHKPWKILEKFIWGEYWIKFDDVWMLIIK